MVGIYHSSSYVLDMCIRDKKLRIFNWLTIGVFLLQPVFSVNWTQGYALWILTALIVIMLIVCCANRILKIPANVIIFSCLLSFSFANLFFYDFSYVSIPYCILHTLPYIPICIWALLGLRDGIRTLAANDTIAHRISDENKKYIIETIFIFGYTILLLRWWWHGFLPYGSSPDTRNQWNQIHGIIRYSDVHSLGHTIFLKILLSIWDDYVIVIWFHVIAMAILYSLFSAFLMKNGVSFASLVIGITVFNCRSAPLSPVVFPWKDLPYSLCIGILTLLLMKDNLDELRGMDSAGILKSILYGLVIAGSFILRKNGILILIFVGMYLAVIYIRRGFLKQLAVMIVTSAILITGTNWYGYQVLGSDHAENGFSVAVFGSGIAAAVNDGHMTQEELDVIGDVLPVDWMKDNYGGPFTTALIWNYDDTVLDPNMQVYNNQFVIAMGKNPGAVVRIYIRLLPRHWRAYIKNILFSTRSIWGHSNSSILMIYDNSSIVLLIAFVITSLYKKKMAKSWIVLVPAALNIISIAISAITNETRYLYPTVMLAPFILLYIFVLYQEITGRKKSAAHE